VPVYATVQDLSGRLVIDLTKDSFKIFEDGTPVEITQFSHERQPLSMAVMLDMSGSITGLAGHSREAMDRLRRAVLAFLRSLEAGDRASLGSFNGMEIAVGANLTNDLREFDRVMQEELWAGGGTPLWQAISVAAKSISRESGRRVAVFLTDGVDTGALPGWRGDKNTVAQEMAEAGTMVYFVRPPVKNVSATRPLPQNTREFSQETGGGYLEIPTDTDSDYQAIFGRLAEELRHQYLLGFSPRARDGKLHNIEARTTDRQLIVRARQSFRAGG